MRIFRIVLLAFAMALFVINFWAIDYQDIWGKESLWAYFRIAMSFVLVLLLVRLIKRSGKKLQSRH